VPDHLQSRRERETCDFQSPQRLGLPDRQKDGRPRPLWIPRGIVIPLIVGGAVHRIRMRREKADFTPNFNLPYFMLPGSSAASRVMGDNALAFVVVEAELDAVKACATSGYVARRAYPNRKYYKDCNGIFPEAARVEYIDFISIE